MQIQNPFFFTNEGLFYCVIFFYIDLIYIFVQKVVPTFTQNLKVIHNMYKVQMTSTNSMKKHSGAENFKKSSPKKKIREIK